MIKIAIYCRKSVEKENSISVENQLEFCKTHFLRLYDDCEFLSLKMMDILEQTQTGRHLLE